MLDELTFFVTFALQHLLIGLCLFLVLVLLIKLFDFTAELQSWLWVTAFFVTALIPFVPATQHNEPGSDVERRPEIIAQILDNNAGSQNTVENLEPQFLVENSSNKFAAPAIHWSISTQLMYGLAIWFYFLLFIWFVGSCWRMSAVINSVRHTREILANAYPIESMHKLKGLEDLRIHISRQAQTPMAAGLFSPVVILPKSLTEQLSREQLAPIILHEWAHIQRRDLWVATLQEFFAIVFWWSPIIRILNRKIHVARELACDMRAAKKLEDGKQYAQSLVDCASLMLTHQKNVLAVGLFSKKKDLTRRVNEVLKIKNVSMPKLVTTLIVCLAFAVTSFSLAQNYAPQINLAEVDNTVDEFPADAWAVSSRAEGEKLLGAVRKGDFVLLKKMLGSGYDANTLVPGEGTPLLEAVRSENEKMVKFLIDYGADVNLASKWDGSPLIAAATTDNILLAKILIKNGADINGVVETDETPLINASRHGHMGMVKFLVDNGADVNLGVNAWVGGEFQYRSPLNMASDKKIRAYLVSKGATKK